MATTRPPRFMDPFNREFWEFASKRDFRLQGCSECGKLRWPASMSCDECLSEAYEWKPMSGRGTVLSWIVFERAYFPEYPAPHPAVAVELDEGPIFVCTMPPGEDPDALSDGLPMILDWLDGEDQFGEYFLPVFRPA